MVLSRRKIRSATGRSNRRIETEQTEVLASSPVSFLKTMLIHLRSSLCSGVLLTIAMGRLVAQNAEPTPVPQLQTQSTTIARSSDATDAARYLAGLPIADTSNLSSLTRDPHWQAHAAAMNTAFAQLEQ